MRCLEKNASYDDSKKLALAFSGVPLYFTHRSILIPTLNLIPDLSAASQPEGGGGGCQVQRDQNEERSVEPGSNDGVSVSQPAVASQFSKRL